MKARIIITELSHDDLVDILSTALYGCDWAEAGYEPSFLKKIPKDKKTGDCFEDHLADVLLNGGTIEVVDNYADGQLYPIPGVPCKLRKVDWWELGTKKEYEAGVYTLNLKAFLKACSSERGYKLMTKTLNGDGDYFTANDLLQIAMFGKEIYG